MPFLFGMRMSISTTSAAKLLRQFHRLFAVGRHACYLEVGVRGKYRLVAAAHQLLVVGYQYGYPAVGHALPSFHFAGTKTSTHVPPWGEGATSNVPSSSRTRSRMPSMPWPPLAGAWRAPSGAPSDATGAGSGVAAFRPRHPATVVAHVHDHAFPHVPKGDGGLAGMGVPDHVRAGFAGDSEQRDVNVRGHRRPVVALHEQVAFHAWRLPGSLRARPWRSGCLPSAPAARPRRFAARPPSTACPRAPPSAVARSAAMDSFAAAGSTSTSLSAAAAWTADRRKRVRRHVVQLAGYADAFGLHAPRRLRLAGELGLLGAPCLAGGKLLGLFGPLLGRLQIVAPCLQRITAQRPPL